MTKRSGRFEVDGYRGKPDVSLPPLGMMVVRTVRGAGRILRGLERELVEKPARWIVGDITGRKSRRSR